MKKYLLSLMIVFCLLCSCQQLIINGATYMVSYDGNENTEGIVPSDANKYTTGFSVTVAGAGSMAKNASTFIGWNTARGGTGTNYFPSSIFLMPANNVILYAQWTMQSTYSVMYNGNGNTGGTVPTDPNHYLPGTPVSVQRAGTMNRAGHTFSSWNTAINGSGTSYTSGTAFSMPASNMTLYAQWSIETGNCKDDFESYSLHAWPGTWTADANAISNAMNNRVETDPMVAANQVLKLYGQPGEYWGALGYRACTIPTEFTFDLRIYNGADSIPDTGHQDRGEVHLRSGTNWSNYSRNLLTFDKAGNAIRSDLSIIKKYELEKWHRVRIHYLRTGTTLKISYWIDGENAGSATLSIASLPQEESLDHIGLSAQAGTVYFDDINLQAGAPKVTVEGNSMWNRYAYFSWRNIAHVYQPDSRNAVIDTWKVDTDGNGDPRDNENRILWNGQTDTANGINFRCLNGPTSTDSGWGVDAFIDAQGNGIVTFTWDTSKGTATVTYRLEPESGDLNGELTLKTTNAGDFYWGLNMINSVWVNHNPGTMLLYNQAYLNGALITARSSALNGESVEGLDFLRASNVRAGVAAIFSSTKNWKGVFALQEASADIELRSWVCMASAYGGWGFNRCAIAQKSLAAGGQIYLKGVFKTGL